MCCAAAAVEYETNALETVYPTLAPGAMSHIASVEYMRQTPRCIIFFYLHNVLMFSVHKINIF